MRESFVIPSKFYQILATFCSWNCSQSLPCQTRTVFSALRYCHTRKGVSFSKPLPAQSEGLWTSATESRGCPLCRQWLSEEKQHILQLEFSDLLGTWEQWDKVAYCRRRTKLNQFTTRSKFTNNTRPVYNKEQVHRSHSKHQSRVHKIELITSKRQKKGFFPTQEPHLQHSLLIQNLCTGQASLL